MNKKVSILSPCYNVEKHINKFIESILMQNYQPIELIMVDDGSTDSTGDKILSYSDILNKHGIKLKYLKKENGGLASAIAYGLKHVEGDYLIWPDPDDFLLKNSIQVRVNYFEEHPDCGLLRCNGYVYNEKDLVQPKSKVSKLKRNTYLRDFVSFIVPWCPGCYMVRMEVFDDVNPNRELYLYKYGQDIQMILPVVAKYECEYLDELVYGYVIYKNSMSHSIRGYDQHLKKLSEYNECVRETLKLISGCTDEYFSLNCRFIQKQKCRFAWQYKKYSDLELYLDEIKKRKEMDLELYIMKFMPYNRISRFFVRCANFITNRINLFKSGN